MPFLVVAALAWLVAYVYVGLAPKIMAIGPVPATRMVRERAGLNSGDLNRRKSTRTARGIAPCHPVGVTSAITTAKAICKLHRTGDKRVLVTICIGGGQSIVAIFERTRKQRRLSARLSPSADS